MSSITRDHIQLNADFKAWFFGLTDTDSLASEAMELLNDTDPKNFDSYETLAWLRSYLPSSLDERHRISRLNTSNKVKVNTCDSYFNSFCHQYTVFVKNYPFRSST